MDLEQHQLTVDAIATYAQRVTFGGATWTVIMSNINIIAAFVGIFVSLCGLIVMIYYKNKAHLLEEEARFREVEAIEKYYADLKQPPKSRMVKE